MQVIFENEDEGGDSRRTDAMGPLICAGRIHRCMKEECNGGTCYELKFLEWNKRTTLVLSNIRELNKELFYKLVYLI